MDKEKMHDISKNSIDQVSHLKGKSVFVDDISCSEGTLFATVYSSSEAHCRINQIDLSSARHVEGVVEILTAADIPGENQIGAIIKDEPLLAEGNAHYIGQPVALILAKSKEAGMKARERIRMDTSALDVIHDPRKAYRRGDLIVPPRIFSIGDINKAWDQCNCIVSGTIESGGQEHFYLETQSALAVPVENDGIKIYSSTQSPTGVQKTVAKVLGLIENRVEVDVRRLGGGFGGKEDQASHWAALASLGAYITKKSVKLVLNRNEDIRMTGKRHPYSYDYKMGIDGQGKILAYEAFYYQNAGASADLSTAILERSLFHGTNSYYIPNVKITAASCRTNLPPNTAFRGFGAPQAIFVLEYALNRVAEQAGIDIDKLQKMNLIQDGDRFPYGMALEDSKSEVCWNLSNETYRYESLKADIDRFNQGSHYIKRGIYRMPVCFGISFTNTILNQAGALVHVYSDGSVNVSTGAVEMGQGVNLKIAQIASTVFGIPLNKIRVEPTNTSRVANTSPTAASSGADLNGKASEIACQSILERLTTFASELLKATEAEKISIIDGWVYRGKKRTELNWEVLVMKAYLARINLSGQGFYATPDIYFDRSTEKGKPFAYHVFGNAIISVSVDCLKGIYTIDGIRIIHDVGKSINPKIDRGQIEGAVIQGLGWMTMEELHYHEDGTLMNGSASGYKVPDIKFVPDLFEVQLHEDSNPKAVFGSKAVGEPPFIYGIGGYFAIIEAMKAFKPDSDFQIAAPLTAEKILLALHNRS